MNNPDQYILAAANTVLANACSNLDWAKTEAVNRAQASDQSQVLYKLVPVFRVDVKVKRDYQTTDLTEK